MLPLCVSLYRPARPIPLPHSHLAVAYAHTSIISFFLPLAVPLSPLPPLRAAKRVLIYRRQGCQCFYRRPHPSFHRVHAPPRIPRSPQRMSPLQSPRLGRLFCPRPCPRTVPRPTRRRRAPSHWRSSALTPKRSMAGPAGVRSTSASLRAPTTPALPARETLRCSAVPSLRGARATSITRVWATAAALPLSSRDRSPRTPSHGRSKMRPWSRLHCEARKTRTKRCFAWPTEPSTCCRRRNPRRRSRQCLRRRHCRRICLRQLHRTRRHQSPRSNPPPCLLLNPRAYRPLCPRFSVTLGTLSTELFSAKRAPSVGIRTPRYHPFRNGSARSAPLGKCPK